MPGILSGWIANCVFKVTLCCYWSTSYGERVMSMQFQITMIAIAFGKRLSGIRSLINTTTPWSISNSNFIRLMGWRDSMPPILESCFRAVCSHAYHIFTFFVFMSTDSKNYVIVWLIVHYNFGNRSNLLSVSLILFYSANRRTRRVFDNKGTHANVKSVFLSLVQWGGSFYP